MEARKKEKRVEEERKRCGKGGEEGYNIRPGKLDLLFCISH